MFSRSAGQSRKRTARVAHHLSVHRISLAGIRGELNIPKIGAARCERQGDVKKERIDSSHVYGGGMAEGGKRIHDGQRDREVVVIYKSKR